MERAISADDLLGGILRFGQAGMGRTDSEAAFQEFLKRIPSATNLAAVATSQQLEAQQQVSHLQQQAQQLHQAAFQPQVSNSLLSGTSLPLTTPPMADVAAAAGLGAIPRVPSLEFLRQLVSLNQQHYSSLSQSAVKSEGTGHLGLPVTPADLATLPATGLSAALQAVPALAGPGNPLAAAGLSPAAAAAAALQLNALGQLRLGANAAVVEKESYEKAELRRARRMLSNRESARRSRRRKQEHLSTLEVELNQAQDEKKAWTDRLSSLERRCTSAEDENKRLKEENERLREELRFLRTELLDRKERNGYGYRRDRDYEEDDSPPKRRRPSADPPKGAPERAQENGGPAHETPASNNVEQSQPSVAQDQGPEGSTAS